MATGVIDTKDYLQGLVNIGYVGFVCTDPFNQAMNELENDDT